MSTEVRTSNVRADLRLALGDRPLLWTLVGVALATFGFELFTFTISIDSEISGPLGARTAWVAQGRWGMYVLNLLLNPYRAVPVVPTLLAVSFELGALLLLTAMLRDGEPAIDRALAGAVGMAYPGICFIFAFKTISYGVGIGLFLCVVSVYAYSLRQRLSLLVAVGTAAFAVSIYQSLMIALVVVYALWLAARVVPAVSCHGRSSLREAARVVAVLSASLIAYVALNKLVLVLLGVRSSGYAEGYWNLTYLLNNTLAVLTATGAGVADVFTGAPNVYVVANPWLAILSWASLASVLIQLVRIRQDTSSRLFFLLLLLTVCLAPFGLHLLNQGQAPMRSMVALPFVFWGIAWHGLRSTPTGLRWLVRLVIVMTVLNFSLTANRLFGSAHLALEADRIFAAQLLEPIAAALSTAPGVRYLELVGTHSLAPSHLMEQRETLGASFFDWDEGNTGRVLGFLGTLGFDPHLEIARGLKRVELVTVGAAMPSWPNDGYVKVHTDTLIVKLGPYTPAQKRSICLVKRVAGFCERD